MISGNDIIIPSCPGEYLVSAEMRSAQRRDYPCLGSLSGKNQGIHKITSDSTARREKRDIAPSVLQSGDIEASGSDAIEIDKRTRISSSWSGKDDGSGSGISGDDITELVQSISSDSE